jgi:hypothetical protein
MPSLKIFTILLTAICCAAAIGCTPPETEAPTNPPAQTPAEPDMEAEPAEPEPSAALDAESLVGTTWTVADYTIAFEDDGW